MDPAELPAGMAAADRDLPGHGSVADAGFDPRADRIDVRGRLADTHGEPLADRLRPLAIAPAGVPPQRDVLAPVHDDEVEHAVDIEVDERGARARS